MNEQKLSKNNLLRVVFVRLVLFSPLMGAMFFLPAWSFAYWQAWVYIAILFIPMLFIMTFLLKNSPELLERRMRMKEKVSRQKSIVTFSLPFFLLAFILPGFDIRLGWSHVPNSVVIVAEVVVFLSYFFVFLVFKENSYASRIIEVEQNQKVISSGPYALVRHPMYTGAALMYTFSPLALGSYWAALPALVTIPVLVARILNEEIILARDLPGYTQYMQKVRYRMLPGIW